VVKRMKATLESFGPRIVSKAELDAICPDARASKEDLVRLASEGWSIEPSERRADFRTHWTKEMGFREFVQNALDAAESFAMEYDEANDISYIIDDGPGFAPESMLLGSEKAKSDKDLHCLRGVYGEGMKIAFQPFLKAGDKILIRTKGFDYTFLIAKYRDTDIDYLVKLSRPNNVTTGTTIAVEGFDCRKFEDKVVQCLPEEEIMFSVVGGKHEYDDCKIRQVLARPGDIYFRDIFVSNINKDDRYSRLFLFGYNFWFNKTISFLGPDRTQFNPDGDALADEISYIVSAFPTQQGQIFLVELLKRLKTAIDAGIEKSRIFEYSVLNTYFDHIRWNASKKNQAAMVAFDAAVKQAFNVTEYSSPVGYDEASKLSQRKALEHLDVVNIEEYLPSRAVEHLAEFGLTKTGLQWQQLKDLDNVTELPPTRWEEEVDKLFKEDPSIFNSSSNEVKRWKSQVNVAYNYVQSNLNRIASEAAEGYRVKFFERDKQTKQTEIDKVGGYCEYKTKTIWIKISKLRSLNMLLEVFIHELGHAMCQANSGDNEDYCSDLHDGFERYLVKAGIYCFGKQKEITDLGRRLDVLNKFDLAERLAKATIEGVKKARGKSIARLASRDDALERLQEIRDILADPAKHVVSDIDSSIALTDDAFAEVMMLVPILLYKIFGLPHLQGVTPDDIKHGEYRFPLGVIRVKPDGSMTFISGKGQFWAERIWHEIWRSGN